MTEQKFDHEEILTDRDFLKKFLPMLLFHDTAAGEKVLSIVAAKGTSLASLIKDAIDEIIDGTTEEALNEACKWARLAYCMNDCGKKLGDLLIETDDEADE